VTVLRIIEYSGDVAKVVVDYDISVYEAARILSAALKKKEKSKCHTN
jgi:hypothetical protein